MQIATLTQRFDLARWCWGAHGRHHAGPDPAGGADATLVSTDPLGAVSADLHNFDQFLVRDPRLLVPVDVQALVVTAGDNDTERMITPAVP